METDPSLLGLWVFALCTSVSQLSVHNYAFLSVSRMYDPNAVSASLGKSSHAVSFSIFWSRRSYLFKCHWPAFGLLSRKESVFCVDALVKWNKVVSIVGNGHSCWPWVCLGLERNACPLGAQYAAQIMSGKEMKDWMGDGGRETDLPRESEYENGVLQGKYKSVAFIIWKSSINLP